MEQAYQEGQKAFRAGNLTEALAHWEMVDRVAPDHESVRSYLIKAYRLAGVEMYGQNELPEAVKIWKKAERLDQP